MEKNEQAKKQMNENYENRIVLFLDILGFKKIVGETMIKKDNETENEDIEKTTFIIETIKEMIKTVDSTNKETTRSVTQFSDSIVISFKENDEKEIPKLFQNLQLLIAKLLAREILCRGAISYGKLYHNSNLIFGPALVDAYETETEAALYPRVILDKSVVDIMKSNFALGNKNNYSKMLFDSEVDSILKTDTDDKFYIDYFTEPMIFYRDEDLFSVYKKIRKMITNGLRYKDPSIAIKYGWMKNKYNQIPETLRKLNEEEELFFSRRDIEKFYKEFKPIN